MLSLAAHPTVLVSAVLTAGSLALAGPAGAATYTHDDARGDVVSINPDDSTTPRSHAAGGDITSLRTRFRGQTITVTTTLAAVKDAFGVDVSVKTPRSPTPYDVSFTYGALDGPELVLVHDGDLVDCPGLDAKVHGADRQVVVKVPRSCLAGTRIVRTGVVLTTSSEPTTSDAPGEQRFDDAQRDGGTPRGIVLGPRVRRN